jgi:hypothetical protein
MVGWVVSEPCGKWATWCECTLQFLLLCMLNIARNPIWQLEVTSERHCGRQHHCVHISGPWWLAKAMKQGLHRNNTRFSTSLCGWALQSSLYFLFLSDDTFTRATRAGGRWHVTSNECVRWHNWWKPLASSVTDRGYKTSVGSVVVARWWLGYLGRSCK